MLCRLSNFRQRTNTENTAKTQLHNAKLLTSRSAIQLFQMPNQFSDGIKMYTKRLFIPCSQSWFVYPIVMGVVWRNYFIIRLLSLSIFQVNQESQMQSSFVDRKVWRFKLELPRHPPTKIGYKKATQVNKHFHLVNSIVLSINYQRNNFGVRVQ